MEIRLKPREVAVGDAVLFQQNALQDEDQLRILGPFIVRVAVRFFQQRNEGLCPLVRTKFFRCGLQFVFAESLEAIRCIQKQTGHLEIGGV
jgi:hypothetical protein